MIWYCITPLQEYTNTWVLAHRGVYSDTFLHNRLSRHENREEGILGSLINRINTNKPANHAVINGYVIEHIFFLVCKCQLPKKETKVPCLPCVQIGVKITMFCHPLKEKSPHSWCQELYQAYQYVSRHMSSYLC